MVDIVAHADAEVQAVQVVDRGEDIVHGHGGADQQIVVLFQQLLLLGLIAGLLQNAAQLGKAYALVDAGFLYIKVKEGLGIHSAVGNHLHLVLANAQHHHGNTGAVGSLGGLTGDLFALGDENFTGERSDHVLGGNKAGDAACQRELFIHLIAAEARQIIAAGVKEQCLQMVDGAFHRGGLTGAQLAVGFQQGFLAVVGGVFFQRGQNAGILAEEIQNLFIAALFAQCTDQHGHGQLAVFIDAHIEHIVDIGFIFQPCAAVGVHGGGVQLFAQLVKAFAVENTGAANQLADDHSLGAVDDKGTAVGHQREVAHEDFLLFQLARGFVEQACGHAQGCGIGGIAQLALVDAVFGIILQAEINKIQHKVTGVILDRCDILEYLLQPFVQKPLIRVFLDLDQVGHVNDFVDAGETHSLGFTAHLGLDLHHKKQPLLTFWYLFGSVHTA